MTHEEKNDFLGDEKQMRALLKIADRLPVGRKEGPRRINFVRTNCNKTVRFSSASTFLIRSAFACVPFPRQSAARESIKPKGKWKKASLREHFSRSVAGVVVGPTRIHVVAFKINFLGRSTQA